MASRMLPSENIAQLLHDYRSADTNGRDDNCFAITPRLIGGASLSSLQEKMVDDLDQAIANAPPIESDMVLYRGCAPGEVMDKKPYPSFLSTSSDLQEALRFQRGCLIRFEIPATTKILRISPSVGSVATLEQNEYLLPRNMTFYLEQWQPDEDEALKLMLAFVEVQLVGLRAAIA